MLPREEKSERLINTGSGVGSPRDVSKMAVNDLENAPDDFVAGRPVRTPLTNPIGCNIKWDGKDPPWMPVEACDLV